MRDMSILSLAYLIEGVARIKAGKSCENAIYVLVPLTPVSVVPKMKLFPEFPPTNPHPAKGKVMKKVLLACALCLSLAVGVAYAAPVRDWHDLDAVHRHVVASISEMEKARAKNHYDMDGHGAKAEELLRQAEAELKAAVESAKAAK